VEVLNHQHVHRPYKQDIELAFLIFDIEIELAQVESDPLANARKRVVAIKNHSCTEMMVASKVRVVSGWLRSELRRRAALEARRRWWSTAEDREVGPRLVPASA
jgi:hypothetical protein